MMKQRLSFLILLLLTSVCMLAQTRREVIRSRVDSVLQAKYERGSYDTSFISRPKERLTVKTRANLSGFGVHARGGNVRADLYTDAKATLSLAVIYRGLSAGLAVNPASLSGRNKDYEFNVNSYGNRFCVEASYQTSKTLKGTTQWDGVSYDVERGAIDLSVFAMSAYYIFNHHRFSFPAAFTQSYLQKKSAGSWLLGASYQGGRMKTLPDEQKNVMETKLHLAHLGIGGGYGYNWVVGKKWMFHLSALPTLVVYSHDHVVEDGQRVNSSYKFPAFILNEHVAAVCHLSPKNFLSFTLSMSHLLRRNGDTVFGQSKTLARLAYGMRFW